MSRGLTEAEMKAQGARCPCKGADDMCVCQNVPDAITRRERAPSSVGDYHGHMTRADGTHVLLTAEDAKALWEQVERAKAERTERMPTEKDALNVMFSAWQRLKELGWTEAIYCPKDGTIFDSISAGSTGIHPCHYDGKWPHGTWWVHEAGDLWPDRPILFRLRPETK